MEGGTYHFLDVGDAKYGECTLVDFGTVRILIDGGHPQDFRGRRGTPSIPQQLEGILGPPPHDIDLIVVTHCHADHVGCLPELVTQGIVRPSMALLTDPHLGFGRSIGDRDGPRVATQPRSVLASLLREEDASDLNDPDLDTFIDAVVSVEGRYIDLVRDLRARGAAVAIWRGPDTLDPAIAELLGRVGGVVLGPSEDQLLFCAEQIATSNGEAVAAVLDAGAADGEDIAMLYRALTPGGSDAAKGSRGAGMNCQSITIALGPPGVRALLGGDMQFVEAGVPGIDRELAELRRKVIEAGPYKLFKTTHHTSGNGQDAAFLDALGSPSLIVHSGGATDAGHPSEAVLNWLGKREDVFFARTDRNGAIEVSPETDGPAAFRIAKGVLNDFGANVMAEAAEASGTESAVLTIGRSPDVSAPPAGTQIVIVNLPPGPIDLTVAGVDIQVRVPDLPLISERPPRPAGRHRAVASKAPSDDGIPAVAAGRDFSRLLFVTDTDRLGENIGKGEAASAIEAIKRAGGEMISASGDDLVARTQDRLKSSPDRDGLVLLGGYDVVPTARRDVLGTEFRKKLGTAKIANDHDQFWIWSDASYGDLDGDAVAELPISRIPDGRDAQLFLGALGAKPLTLGDRFGVHNINRPFATDVWNDVSGTRAIYASQHFSPADVVAAEVTASCHYYMLHGDEADARVFQGENDDNRGVPAFDIDKVPATFQGFVFSGCCWGALIVRGKAVGAVSNLPLPRLTEESIALSYLKAGAVAFVGCTGSHYSGDSADRDANFAYWLHQAFWSRIREDGVAPARALFEAKAEFAERIVAGAATWDAVGTARRMKNLAQFTCLGLGW